MWRRRATRCVLSHELNICLRISVILEPVDDGKYIFGAPPHDFCKLVCMSLGPSCTPTRALSGHVLASQMTSISYILSVY